MQQDEQSQVRNILKIAEGIYGILMPGVTEEWLSSDLTVAQLRVMLVLHTEGPSRMSSIAAATNVALPTATGIADNLVKKGLVTRVADLEDRRVVICELSPKGQEITGRLWAMGRFQMEKLLAGLSPEQLDKSAEVAGFLLSNIKDKAGAGWLAT